MHTIMDEMNSMGSGAGRNGKDPRPAENIPDFSRRRELRADLFSRIVTMMKKNGKVRLRQILGLFSAVLILCGAWAAPAAAVGETAEQAGNPAVSGEPPDQTGNPAASEDESIPLADGIRRSGDYLFRVLEDGTAEITEYLSDEGITRIPSALAGIPVSAIGDRAFSNQGDIKYYTDEYPDYHRAGIQRIQLPEGLVRIGAYAFEDCFNLRSVTLPSTLRVIGEGAFADCRLLMDTALPDQLEELGAYAFRGCHALTGMNLPASLKKIGANPFAGCSHFRRLDPAAGHPFLRYEGGMLYDSETQTLIACTTEAWKSPVTLPASVRIIGEAAFAAAPVETLVIPDSVTAVGSYAFADSALQKLLLPASLETMGANPVRNCLLLSEPEIRSERFAVRDGALIDETEHRLIACLPPPLPDDFQREYAAQYQPAEPPADGARRDLSLSSLRDELYAWHDVWNVYSDEGGFSYTVPDGIRTIGASAFWGLPVVTAEMPDSVNAIGSNAFSHCRLLESCRIPEGLKRMENGLFDGCENLTEIRFPEGLQTIGAYAFYESGITQAILPDTVTSIGAYAFARCGNLKDIRFSEALTEIPRGALAECGADRLELPAGITRIGIQAFAGMQYLDQSEIDLPDGLTVISDFAFFNTPFYAISIPSGVTCIGDQAFRIDGYSSPQMISFSFPENLRCLGNKAFMGQGLMEEITLPGGLEWMGESVFCDCGSLMKAVLSEGITALPDQTFIRSGLKEIRLPETLQRIGSLALSETPLPSVELPAQALEITGNPFRSCRSLSRVVLAENHPNLVIRDHLLIDESRRQVIAFLNEDQEPSCVIPEGIQVIGAYALEDPLQEVKLPESLREIREYAFSGCELESVTLPEGLERIGDSAFVFNPLTEIRLPEGLKEIGEEAFGSTCLSDVAIPSSVERIGTGAFDTGTLKQVTFRPGGAEPEGNPLADTLYQPYRGGTIPRILIPEGHPTLTVSDGNLYNVRDHRLLAQLTDAPVREDTEAVARGALKPELPQQFPAGIRDLPLTDENFCYMNMVDECRVVPGSACEAFLEAGIGWPSVSSSFSSY